MATRKPKRRSAARKTGRRPSSCQLCERQMKAQAKKLSTAQRKREQILLRRVKRSGGRRTGQRVGVSPTGLVERAIVLPQSYGGGGFRSAGPSPYFMGRDPRSRGRSKKARSRDRSREWTYSGPSGRSISLASRPERDYRRTNGSKKHARDPRSREREWTYSTPGGRSLSLATRPERDYRRTKRRSAKKRSRARDESRDWRTQPIRHARAAVLGWERRGNPYPRNPDKFTGKRRPPLFSPVGKYRKRHPKSQVGQRDFIAAAARDFYRRAPKKRKRATARYAAPKRRRSTRARDNYALDLRPRGRRAGF